ncbi:centrosomal protein 20 [Scleropages formosus]|uniref:Centrosomal protein 20 n=2 Tax=Scleropages formosus TaxID=113540 RepID=A0A8C9RPX7_SCLFO|nr:lisH domain-containing protein FOPNL [Scleropages formosus]
MATVGELKTALKETLESRGVLGQLKARIRAEVFHALDDTSEPRPSLSHENLLLNELIREYLLFNKYRYTASVLTAESGQPEVPLDRQFMANELNVVEDPSASTMPLLYGLLSHFLNSGGEKGGKLFLRSSGAPAQRDVNVRPMSDANRIGVNETFPAGKSSREHFVLQGGYR